MALVAVVAYIGGIESSKWFVAGTACSLWRSVNKLRKGKDAAAERLCSTLTNGDVAACYPPKRLLIGTRRRYHNIMRQCSAAGSEAEHRLFVG